MARVGGELEKLVSLLIDSDHVAVVVVGGRHIQRSIYACRIN